MSGHAGYIRVVGCAFISVYAKCTSRLAPTHPPQDFPNWLSDDMEGKCTRTELFTFLHTLQSGASW